MRPLTTVAAGAVLISFAPVLVKLAIAAGVDTTAIAFWRTLVGGALLFAIARAGGARLRIRHRWRVPVIGGIAFAIDLFAFHKAIDLVGAGLATVLTNTQVFWTLAIGRLAFGERLGLRFVWAVGLAFVGIALLSGAGSELVRSAPHLAGIGFGLLTGLAYACYIVVLQRSAPIDQSRAAQPLLQAMVTLAWVTTVSAGTTGALTLVEGQSLNLPSARALGLVATLALVAQVVGWLILTRGLQRARASRAALVILLQPALATLWGVVFFAEPLSALQLIGVGLTLGGVYVGSRGI